MTAVGIYAGLLWGGLSTLVAKPTVRRTRGE
jgi:hypothetical protein